MFFGLTAPAAVMVTVGLLPDGGGVEAEGGVVGPPPDEPPPPQDPMSKAITAAGATSPKKRDDPGDRLAVEPPPIATRFAPGAIQPLTLARGMPPTALGGPSEWAGFRPFRKYVRYLFGKKLPVAKRRLGI